MNGTNLRSFGHFQIWSKSHTRALLGNFKIDFFRSLTSLTVKMRKSIKMINIDCKHDLHVFS